MNEIEEQSAPKIGAGKIQPKFLSVEGGEGAGKSTLINTLKLHLEETGERVVLTREPGGTSVGEKVREILLDKSHSGLVDKAELLLMFAARVQLVQEIILPALANGAWVISDRFVDASFAYQGGGRGLGMAVVQTLADMTVKDCLPSLTLLLDLPVETGLKRARGRSEPDRIEAQDLYFFEQVRAAYLMRAREYSDRVKVLDGTQSVPQLSAEACRVLDAHVKSRV